MFVDVVRETPGSRDVTFDRTRRYRMKRKTTLKGPR